MGRFLIRRLLASIPLLFGISIILFGIIHLAPGGPLSVYGLVPNLEPDELRAIAESMGLNDPIHIQYFKWVAGVVTGQWGYSYGDGRPVTRIIFERLPNTLTLTGASLLIQLAIGIPVGIFTATRASTWIRHIVGLGTLAAVSLPTFWVGLMVILYFAGTLRVIPSGGMYTIGAPFSILDRLKHLIGPAMVLATAGIASWTRYTHANVLDVMLEDYIRTARAKGLRERVVLYRHAFRNVLVTLVTLLGLSFPALVSGALVTEAVFGWPGNGRLLVDALVRRDYPLVMGNFMLIALMVVSGNLIADLAYGLLDPRVRYD